MNVHCTRAAIACAALVSAEAAAWGPPPVPITVDNDAGAQVEVWVDGQWRGSVLPAQNRSFTTLPGSHRVQATWPDGTYLLDVQVSAHPGQGSYVQVLPPSAQLVLTNCGAAPVWVEIAGMTPQWSMPGTRTPVALPWAPALTVQTSIYGRRGLVTLAQMAVSPRPGQSVPVEVGWTAPTPTSTVTMTNGEDHTVRVYIAGAEAAVIPPGQTRFWDVLPGRFQVTIVEHQDGVVFDQAVTFDPRRDHQLLIDNGRGRFQAADVYAAVDANRGYPRGEPW